jgi:hypothetical protein
MAQSILIFDFGTNEEAAQQARHKLEGWKQAFHLDKKVLLKFDRVEPSTADDAAGNKAADKKKQSASEAKDKKPDAIAHIRLFIRLDFSDHEKLSHHRWLDRIPSEEPFKSVKAEVVRHTDPAFAKTAEHFDSLD